MGEAHVKVDTSMHIAETKNQIRSESGLCGGENRVGKSVEAGTKEGKAEVRLKKAPSSTSGAGAAVALKSASGECSALQQMWLGSGASGVEGADS
jgi:hypothetical protein